MINVWFDTVNRIVTINREESSPSGGMDSYAPTSWHLSDLTKVRECLAMNQRNFAEQIVKGVKSMIDSECGETVKRYGKPTKNFAWTTHDDKVVKGLSVKNCLLALQGL